MHSIYFNNKHIKIFKYLIFLHQIFAIKDQITIHEIIRIPL